MKKPIYREALKNAWLLTWRNTSLWLVGLIAALFAGSFGLGNFISQLILTMTAGGRAAWLLTFGAPSLGTSGAGSIFWLIWICLIMLVLCAAVIFISISAKSTLLIATAEYYKKQVTPRLSKIWHQATQFFWKILAIEAGRKIALALVGIIFGLIWVLLPFQSGILNMIVNIIALTFCIILAWVITAISVFAAGYTVIDNKGLPVAIKKSWKLFHEHLLASFEVAILLTIIDIILMAFFIAMVWAAFVPSLLVWILAGVFGSQILAAFGVLLGVIIFAVIVALAGGIYNTFYSATWMYLFLQMHHEGIASRIFHHVVKWFK